jgi:hypothetical protein
MQLEGERCHVCVVLVFNVPSWYVEGCILTDSDHNSEPDLGLIQNAANHKASISRNNNVAVKRGESRYISYLVCKSR